MQRLIQRIWKLISGKINFRTRSITREKEGHFIMIKGSIHDDLKFLNVYGNSLVVQWLGLYTSTAQGPGLIPGQGTKILQAAW